MNNSDAIAQILKQEGAEYVFCFPSSPLIDAAARAGIRPIMCRTERTVTNMADAYTRTSNGKRIGVCLVQSGPGIENAYVGVAQAFADSTPLLMMPSGPRRARAGLPANYDPVENYRGITKWASTINLGSRVPEMMGRAFTKLRNGRLRPVLLEVPADVASEEADAADLGYEPVKGFRSAADPADVAEGVRLLLGARRPVIYAGQGVLWAEATPELVELAELLRVPLMTTLLGKSGFPEDHPLALGIGGSTVTGMVDRFLSEADLVFCIGASLTQTLAATAIPPGKTLIHCTADEEDLNTEYRADHAIIGDAKLVLCQLMEEAKRQLGGETREHRGGVAEEVRSVRDAWLGQWMPKLTSDEVPINPYRVVWELANTIDRANAIVTHDSGSPRGQMATFYSAPVPRGYIGWGNSHQLGSSLGLAMGAKLAAPDKLSVAFMGDAAFGMCGLDLETAARERIPVLAIVLNNSWMSGHATSVSVSTQEYRVGYLTGEYCKIAEGLGCYSERIGKPEELVPAIKRAVAVTTEGRPAVLEIMSKVESASPVGQLLPARERE